MLSIGQFTEIAKKEAYPVIMDSYDSGGPPVYEQLVELEEIGIDNIDAVLGGMKGTTALGMGEPKERRPGQQFDEGRPGEGYTWYLKIREYAESLSIPYGLVDHLDTRVGDYVAKQIASWGEGFKIVEEKFVAGMFMKGTLTAGSADYFDGSFAQNADPYPKFIYDGLPFFDGAHTQAAGTATFSNIATSSALSAANLQTAYTTMTSTNAKNERNQDITIRPDVLVVPPALKFSAEQILNSTLLPGSANNDINPVNGLLRPVVWRYLTDDATQWILGQSMKGIKVVRSPIQVVAWDDPSRQLMRVAVKRQFGAAVTNWRHWYSADKADS